MSLTDNNFPTYEGLISFICHKTAALDETSPEKPKTEQRAPPRAFHAAQTAKVNCSLCKEDHRMYGCKKFLEKSVAERAAFVKAHHCCFNCRSQQHAIKNCTLRKTSWHCNKGHHSLLHLETNKEPISTAQPTEEPAKEESAITGLIAKIEPALLPTARVLTSRDGRQRHPARAVLDTGAQTDFITEIFLYIKANVCVYVCL